MAVIDLRGSIEGPLARLGGSIGQIVGRIVNPNKEEREEFQDRLRDTPELGAQLAQLDRQSPGFLDTNFGFLKQEVRDSIRALPPSLEELRGEEEIDVFQGLPEEMREQLTKLGLFKDVAGTTPAGAIIEGKREEVAPTITPEQVTQGLVEEVTGVPALTPGQTAQDKFNLEIFNSASTAFGELGLNEQQAATLRAKLPAAFFDPDVQESFRQRKEIAQMQIDAQNLDRANERTDNFRRSVSARWTASTNVGTPEVWQKFLFDVDDNRKGRELDSGAISPENETDIRLLEVAQAFSRADQVEKITQESAVRTQIRTLIDRIEKKDSFGSFVLQKTVREALLNQLNDAFSELTSLSEGRIPLSIGDIKDVGVVKRFFGAGNQPLRIIDESGNEVNFTSESTESQTDTLNLETVDVSLLPQKTRDNLIAIMRGVPGATFERLQEFDPAGAQLILDARRNK